MRTTVAVLAFVALLESAAPARAQFDPLGYDGVNLRECVANATHILVVNPRGVVLEAWKGDARIGEVIPIHTLANLTLTQSRARERGGLGGGAPTHLSFGPWWGDGGERMILFLKKSDEPDPTNGRLGSWRPASKNSFAYSSACVSHFGYVRVHPGSWCGEAGPFLPGLRGSEESIKDEILALLNRPLPADPKK